VCVCVRADCAAWYMWCSVRACVCIRVYACACVCLCVQHVDVCYKSTAGMCWLAYAYVEPHARMSLQVASYLCGCTTSTPPLGFQTPVLPMFVCVCVYACTCSNSVCMCVSMHVHVQTVCACVSMHVHVQTVCACVCVYACTCSNSVCMCVSMHVLVQTVCACVCVHARVCATNAYPTCVAVCPSPKTLSTCSCYLCVYLVPLVYVCVCLWRICVYAHGWVGVCGVCACVCVCTWLGGCLWCVCVCACACVCLKQLPHDFICDNPLIYPFLIVFVYLCVYVYVPQTATPHFLWLHVIHPTLNILSSIYFVLCACVRLLPYTASLWCVCALNSHPTLFVAACYHCPQMIHDHCLAALNCQHPFSHHPHPDPSLTLHRH